MPQHTARLPIACVEGWTTTQEWTGVRLRRARARAAGAPSAGPALVRSLQPRGRAAPGVAERRPGRATRTRCWR